jgi:ribosomal protein L11 methyltransferase
LKGLRPPRVERYHVLEIEGPPESREFLLELIWDLDSLGCEELEDPGRTRLLVYFPSDIPRSELRRRIEGRIRNGGRSPEIAFRLRDVVFDSDSWLDSYSQSFRAFEVGPTFYIHPPWDGPSSRHPVNLLLEPGHGFGTGTHESTQLAMFAVESRVGGVTSLLDVGTGSGILALAAVKLNSELAVTALDIDPLAVEAAAVNFRRNHVSSPLLFAGTTRSLIHPSDLVAANLTCAILHELADELIRLCRRCLVVSGFTIDQTPQVRLLFEEGSPFRVRREWTRNGWSCLLLEP